MNIQKPTRILITAGATHEPIDEVRFIGNRSSGQLGSQIARAAAIAGHSVTLLLGTNSSSPPKHPRLSIVPFSSTRDLSAKLSEYWPSHQILVMAAAVSDFTPQGGQTKGKLKREGAMQIACASTPDLVASIAQDSRSDQRIIAFALEELDNLETGATDKLEKKQVDAIVANPLETMESGTISAVVYLRDGQALTPPSNISKPAFAEWFIVHLGDILQST